MQVAKALPSGRRATGEGKKKSQGAGGAGKSGMATAVPGVGDVGNDWAQEESFIEDDSLDQRGSSGSPRNEVSGSGARVLM